MNHLEILIYHASALDYYINHPPPDSPYAGPKHWPVHLYYVVSALRAVFDLPIVAWAECAEPGCVHVSVYDEVGWRCFEHR